MTSTSSHSEISHSAHGRLTWGSDRPEGCRALLATIVTADLILLVPGVLGLGRTTGSSAALRLAVVAGLLVVVAGLRLILVLPHRRVFSCWPMMSTAGLLTVGAAGLWVSVVRADPIDSLLRGSPMGDVLAGVALFILASMCATLVLVAAAGAWESRLQERQVRRWA